MDCLPIGCILIFPYKATPEGFMPCDGRELLKSSYSELYGVIGGVYGETPKTFCLPDLRGRFVRGWDDEGDRDPDRELGSLQMDALQGHSHNLQVEGETEKNGEHAHDIILERTGRGADSISTSESFELEKIISPTERTLREGVFKAVLPTSPLSWALSSRRKEKITKDLFKTKPTINSGGHSHKLPKLNVLNPSDSTYQPVRVATVTRPQNLALMNCKNVK